MRGCLLGTFYARPLAAVELRTLLLDELVAGHGSSPFRCGPEEVPEPIRVHRDTSALQTIHLDHVDSSVYPLCLGPTGYDHRSVLVLQRVVHVRPRAPLQLAPNELRSREVAKSKIRWIGFLEDRVDDALHSPW